MRWACLLGPRPLAPRDRHSQGVRVGPSIVGQGPCCQGRGRTDHEQEDSERTVPPLTVTQPAGGLRDYGFLPPRGDSALGVEDGGVSFPPVLRGTDDACLPLFQNRVSLEVKHWLKC